MLSLKENYRLEDLLLNEAIQAENRGNSTLAEYKLSCALISYNTKQEDKVFCAESIGEFVQEWSGISDIFYEEKIKRVIYSRAKIKKNKMRRKALRKFKREEEK